MRHLSIAAALAACVAATDVAAAQEAAAPPALAAATPPASTPCCLIPANTPIVLELLEEIASDTKVRGQLFGIRLAEPIVIDGRVVVPAGARGTGEVVDAAKAGMGGRPGELVVAARRLTSRGVEIPLRSFKIGGHGENKSKDAQTTVILVGAVGLFIRGGDIVMPVGARGPAKVARDTTVPPPADAATAPPEPQPQEGKPETP